MSETMTKKAWSKLMLVGCCEEIAERIDKPAESGYERFVGLENLEAGATSIRDWGSTKDVTSSMKLFKTGDVIVARRNVYLRRAARAGFDGVCSGDGIVLRANADICLPELLPYLLNTDVFWNYVTSQADGTMSKRITVKRLLSYEFALPPLEEQRRIAGVLQAAERYQNALYELSNRAVSTWDSIVDHRMRGIALGAQAYHERVGQYSRNWNLVPLGNLLTMTQYGLSDSLSNSGCYPVLRMMNLKDGKVTTDDLKYRNLPDSDFETYKLIPGDVLFNRTNSYELVGRTGVYDLPGNHVFASYLIRLKVRTDRLLPEYLCAYLRAPIGRRQVMSFVTRGVSQANINASNLKRILIPVPPLGYQEDVVDLINAVSDARRKAKARFKSVRLFARKVIAEGLAS